MSRCVKLILLHKIVAYNLRLISYMPDKLAAILFYWSLNAKSSEFLLSSPVCDFHPKHGLKQLLWETNHSFNLRLLVCESNVDLNVTYFYYTVTKTSSIAQPEQKKRNFFKKILLLVAQQWLWVFMESLVSCNKQNKGLLLFCETGFVLRLSSHEGFGFAQILPVG